MNRETDNGAFSLKSAWTKARTKLSFSKSNGRQAAGKGLTDNNVAYTSLPIPSPPSRLQHSSAGVPGTHPHNGTTSRPIFELWDEAFNDLYATSKGLVLEFDAILSKTLTGGIAATQMSVAAFSGLGKVQRRQQMEILLKQKIIDVEKGSWKLSFKNHEFFVKDLVKPVVSVIEWAKEYVDNALVASPYASLAWGGVCLLLPVSVTLSIGNKSLP